VVNDDDVTVVGATYAPSAANANWAAGDFDFNGFVDDDDVTLLGVFYEPPGPVGQAPPANLLHVAARSPDPVVAWSPDHATATTAGLPALRTALETFGQDDVRGQETRAQQLRSGESSRVDHDLVDLLAESVTTENEPQSPSPTKSNRPGSRRSPVLDSVWEHWEFEAV
jgi:hypothetical protein